ncbi:MAG: alpha/beta hydrolase [Alphaproteobacteria bacterium]|nr:alpha/beta hydrolase [Alphaproteobacteria bacterium]MBV9420301.1 alpha/beta hydrolase [Alphaproteobacteria bacterium]MBV9542331.1 alpha/beta hydrolase [Alphaproteobacteria bacterium]MBV9904204.1 alpha/beta hydrolase [Alphaproteobacteria bacterium]
MSNFTRKTLTFPDGDVSYLDWPATAPLLHFAHATGFNAETYQGLLTPLQGRFHVTAADLRGHGHSTLTAVPGPQANWQTFATDLAAILDKLDKNPAVLAGHSMGAMTSMMVAAAHPDRVRGLVLVEPVLVPRYSRQLMRIMHFLGRKPERGSNLAEMAAKRRAVFPSFDMALAAYKGRGAFKTWPEETIADYLRGGLVPTGNGDEMRLGCAPEWESSIFQHAPPGGARHAGKVRCPITVVYSPVSNTTRDREVEIISRRHKGTRLVQVPDTTHFLPMERPDIVQEEIDRMLP